MNVTVKRILSLLLALVFAFSLTALKTARASEGSAEAPEPAKQSIIAQTFAKAKENLSFIAVCLGVFIGLFALALLFEKLVMRERRRRFSDTHFITYTAIFSAMAAVLMLLEFPLAFIAPEFYKLDFSELPIMICTFYLGPVAGVTSELIKIVLKLLIRGTSTAFVGDFANFVVGCAFVLPASMIYHAKPGKKTAAIGLLSGTLIMTVFGSAFNALYLIPKFAQLFHMELDKIVQMGTAVNKHITSVPTLVMYAVAPFNLIKGVLVSILTFLLYKRISPLMHKGDKKRLEKRAGK